MLGPTAEEAAMSSKLPVTVGIDGSKAALIALDWAMEHVRAQHLPLRILNSVDLPRPVVGSVPFPLTELRTEAEEKSRHLLAAAHDRVRMGAPDVEVTQIASLDPPIPSLLRASRGSSLVVVGCRGLNPFEGILLGSVSTGVSAHAGGPVVVVRSPRPIGPGAP